MDSPKSSESDETERRELRTPGMDELIQQWHPEHAARDANASTTGRMPEAPFASTFGNSMFGGSPQSHTSTTGRMPEAPFASTFGNSMFGGSPQSHTSTTGRMPEAPHSNPSESTGKIRKKKTTKRKGPYKPKDEKFQCPKCDRKYPTESALQIHLSNYHRN